MTLEDILGLSKNIKIKILQNFFNKEEKNYYFCKFDIYSTIKENQWNFFNEDILQIKDTNIKFSCELNGGNAVTGISIDLLLEKFKNTEYINNLYKIKNIFDNLLQQEKFKQIYKNSFAEGYDQINLNTTDFNTLEEKHINFIITQLFNREDTHNKLMNTDIIKYLSSIE